MDPIDSARLVESVRRNGRLVIAAAAAVAIITTLLFLLEPRKYRATADVVVPVTEGGPRIAAVGQSVSDFEGALRSAVVAQRVSEETGVPSGDVSSGLGTEQLFGGTVVEVGYEAADPDVAEAVVEIASRAALAVLLRAQLAPIEERLDLAETTAARFEQEYEDFLTRTGLLDPELTFEIQTRRMVELQDEIGRALAEGDEATARERQSVLDRKREELVPLRVEFTLLQEGRSRANAVLAEAQASFVAADAALEAADTGRSVDVAQAVAVPRAAELLRRLLVVVVLATALAIGGIVLLDVAASSASARRRPDERADAAPADAVVLHDRQVARAAGNRSSKRRSKKRIRSG